MKRIIYILLAVLAIASCQKLQHPEKDSSTKLNSLKCFVYADADNLRNYLEVDVLNGGTYSEEKGAIAYTFPSATAQDQEKFNATTLKKCRLEATIPSTATLVELDAVGNELGKGIGGFRDFSAKRTTIYFKIVAADGTEKKYQAQFQFNK